MNHEKIKGKINRKILAGRENFQGRHKKSSHDNVLIKGCVMTKTVPCASIKQKINLIMYHRQRIIF